MFFSAPEEPEVHDGEDCKGRVEDRRDSKQEDKRLSRWIIRHEAEDSVEPEEDGHQGSDIFPDHLQLLILSIDHPDPHIVEGPEGREKEGDDHGDPADDQQPFELKLPPGEEKDGLSGHPGEDLKGCE